jgi:hypothetical protein
MPQQEQAAAWGTQYDDLLWLFAIQHRRVQQAASERLQKLVALKQQQQPEPGKQVEPTSQGPVVPEDQQQSKRARTGDCELQN